MSQVRAEAAVGHRASHRVTVDARSRLENMPSLRRVGTLLCRLLLLLNPAPEFLLRLHVHPQQHLGMLGPATLRTLPEIKAGVAGVDPHGVRMVGNQDGL